MQSKFLVRVFKADYKTLFKNNVYYFSLERDLKFLSKEKQTIGGYYEIFQKKDDDVCRFIACTF